MFISQQDDSAYRVYYRSYRLAALLLLVPPLMLYEFVPSVIDASIESSALAGLIIGVLIPLIGAYFLIEFASFSFSLRDNQFCWRWRNLLRHKSLQIPLQRIVQVRRDRDLARLSGVRFFAAWFDWLGLAPEHDKHRADHKHMRE